MDRDQRHSVPDGSTRTSTVARTRQLAPPTVYDEVASLLRRRGWVKGTPRYRESLCFVAAIDEAVGVGDTTRGGSEAARLARAGRIGSHLRDLVNVRNLAAWSDDRARTLDEVLELLRHAALAFPED
jgi:hypothetical protein